MQSIVELRPDNTRRVWWFRKRWDYEFATDMMKSLGAFDVEAAVALCMSTGAVSDLDVGFKTLPPTTEICDGYHQLVTESELIDCFAEKPASALAL